MKTRPLVPILALLLLVAGCSSATDTETLTEEERVEAFCNLVADGRALEDDLDLNGLTTQMQVAVTAATTDDDPEAIAAIRTWGVALETGGEGIAAIYDGLLDLVDDPALKRGIEISIDLNRDLTASVGKTLSGVDSLAEFNDIMTQFNADMMARVPEAEDLDAILYLDQYSQDNCGFPLSTS
ncbi:MAG: hypothetical protein JW722_01145 [Demequinaceae bacterium]|nr:hypothetical protein [Demequinaceae bacterium]